ncbi:hypothetical protein BC628DRAFT_138186 [Trametes gibbosa]|nr:hypothetical protein BC628DRAFT_138186 [Trametes gibbosa]
MAMVDATVALQTIAPRQGRAASKRTSGLLTHVLMMVRISQLDMMTASEVPFSGWRSMIAIDTTPQIIPVPSDDEHVAQVVAARTNGSEDQSRARQQDARAPSRRTQSEGEAHERRRQAAHPPARVLLCRAQTWHSAARSGCCRISANDLPRYCHRAACSRAWGLALAIVHAERAALGLVRAKVSDKVGGVVSIPTTVHSPASLRNHIDWTSNVREHHLPGTSTFGIEEDATAKAGTEARSVHGS